MTVLLNLIALIPSSISPLIRAYRIQDWGFSDGEDTRMNTSAPACLAARARPRCVSCSVLY